ncbi:hypothetical protein XH90_08190 [Bradyrhizobium sp. CCBAU 53338]|nr:hypothetical protein XH90_08190 [Bradyrhizobium sp. CCBAU 53338]
MGVAHLFAGGPFGHARFETRGRQSRALPEVPAMSASDFEADVGAWRCRGQQARGCGARIAPRV